MRRPTLPIGIRVKAAAALLIFGLTTSLLVSWFIRDAVLSQFKRVERNLADADGESCRAFLDYRARILSAVARDYGFWSETHAFMSGQRPGYPDEHLKPTQLDSLNIDLFALLHDDGRPAAMLIRPLAEGGPPASPDEVVRALAAVTRLFSPGSSEGPSGLWSMPDGLMILSSARVLRSDRTGPSRGFIFIGRRVHGPMLDSLRGITRASPDFAPPTSLSLPQFFIDARSTHIGLRLTLPGLDHQPVADLLLKRPMEQYALAQRTMRGLTAATILLTLLGTVFLLLVLDQIVLSRISRLQLALTRISNGTPPESALRSFKSGDEIGTLAALTRQAFTRLRQGEDLVRASEAKFRAVVEQSPDGIFLADRDDGRFLEANPAFRRLLDLPQPLPPETSSLWSLPGETIPPLPMVRSAFASSGQAAFRLTTPAGTPLQFRLLSIQTGSSSLICGLVEDLAGQEQLKEHIGRAQVAETVGQLAGGVAHDFNNLLTVILSAVQVIAADTRLAAESRGAVEAIAHAARSASELTRKLLFYGRRGPIRPTPCSIPELLGGLKPMLARVIPAHISLHLVCPPDLPPALADGPAIEQAIINLVLNARDALPKGGRITLSAGLEGQRIFIRVEDNGEGMTPEIQRRIFEPFFTTKPPGKGSGLGLSSTQGILAQHGGEIRVQSAPGQGSRFDLLLPRAATSTPDRASSAPCGKNLTTSLSILLVEDDEAIRHILSLLLRRSGFEVLEAATGAEALDLTRHLSKPPDLLISDVVMPGPVSGFDLAARLSADFPGLRIILISAYHPDHLDPLRSVTTAPPRLRFLHKPFAPASLLDEIQAVFHDASTPSPPANL